MSAALDAIEAALTDDEIDELVVLGDGPHAACDTEDEPKSTRDVIQLRPAKPGSNIRVRPADEPGTGLLQSPTTGDPYLDELATLMRQRPHALERGGGWQFLWELDADGPTRWTSDHALGSLVLARQQAAAQITAATELDRRNARRRERRAVAA